MRFIRRIINRFLYYFMLWPLATPGFIIGFLYACLSAGFISGKKALYGMFMWTNEGRD